MRRALLLGLLGIVLVGVALLIWQARPGPTTRPADGRPPARIVSLAPSVTEILFAVGAGDRVVAVTDWCDYPPAAARCERVGGYIDFSIERVVALAPDLIIGAHGIPKDRLERLEALGFKVHAENPASYEELIATIERIGRLVGAEKGARACVARLRGEIDDVTQRLEGLTGADRPRVMYGTWEAPVFVAGPGNFIDETIRLAGGANIAADADTPWPVGYSIERIVANDPEVIVRGFNPTTGLSMGQRAEAAEKLKTDPVWGKVSAVRNGRVIWMDENLLVRPGPRLALGLRELARHLHPDRFPPTETQP